MELIAVARVQTKFLTELMRGIDSPRTESGMYGL